MKSHLFQRARPLITTRCLHLDLKGLPPSAERLLALPKILALLRINCVLLEWEDTYPWTTYPEMRNQTSYAQRTVRDFLQLLTRQGIEIIPLVQSLGHLENVLLKKRFRHLRESPDSAGEICPLHPESAGIIMHLLEDILQTHGPYIRRFHIGGDEPWTFGSCPKCRPFIKKHGQAELYRRHLRPILDFLTRRGLTAMLWDDELRHWPMKLLDELTNRAELVVWQYGMTIFGGNFPPLTGKTLGRYNAAGLKWWGAPACKTCENTTPAGPVRLANIMAWTREMSRQAHKAMIVTGWSRGDFCATASCGLEPAWDMIVLAAAAMWDGRIPKNAFTVAREFMHAKPLQRLVGRPFDACHEAARQLAEWDKQIMTSALWSALEQAASVSSEPHRFNLYTLRRFHGLTGLEREIQQGIKLGNNFIAAHRGLAPEYWLKIFVHAHVQPKIQRLQTYLRTAAEQVKIDI